MLRYKRIETIMNVILAPPTMEHEEKLRKALRIIASMSHNLAGHAMEATRRSGVVLQSRFNEIAASALAEDRLTPTDRRFVVGLIRYSEPDSFDAMLRCRMSKEQLRIELPKRAEAAGFMDISKFIRWVLFGNGAPDHAEVPDNWDAAIEAAIEAVSALGDKPTRKSTLAALADVKKKKLL